MVPPRAQSLRFILLHAPVLLLSRETHLTPAAKDIPEWLTWPCHSTQHPAACAPNATSRLFQTTIPRISSKDPPVYLEESAPVLVLHAPNRTPVVLLHWLQYLSWRSSQQFLIQARFSKPTQRSALISSLPESPLGEIKEASYLPSNDVGVGLDLCRLTNKAWCW